MPEGLKSAVAGLLLAACGVFAQTPATRPVFDSFEVATIKPTPPDWRGGRFNRMQTTHQFVAKGYALKILIATAYTIFPGAISGGPPWIDSDLYDILAEAPGDVRPNLDEQMAMVRMLLANRFKLTVHREPKEFPIYALTIAKTGSKLRESTVSPDATPEGPPPLVFRLSPEGATLPGRNATMAELAAVIRGRHWIARSWINQVSTRFREHDGIAGALRSPQEPLLNLGHRLEERVTSTRGEAISSVTANWISTAAPKSYGLRSSSITCPTS